MSGHHDVDLDGRRSGSDDSCGQLATGGGLGWVYRGGDCGIVVYGTHFVFVESAKIKSLDEMAGLLRQLD